MWIRFSSTMTLMSLLVLQGCQGPTPRIAGKTNPHSQVPALAANPSASMQGQALHAPMGLPSASANGVVPASYGVPREMPVQGEVQGMPHPVQCPCGMHGSGKYQPMLSQLQSEMCNAPCATCPTGFDAQEYVFDGGDRFPKVVIMKDGTAANLQPEDTVVQFELENGNVCVEEACRAAIYAPRFASVRRIDSPIHNDCVVGTQATLLPEGPGLLHEKLPSPSLRQPIAPSREDNVKVVESFRDRNRGTPLERVVPILSVMDAFMPYEDLALVRHGKWNETDKIKLRRGTQAALAWGTVDEVQVFINSKEPLTVNRVAAAAETHVYELNGKPRIRICKVASQQLAEPGDEIHFTIRLDNVGEQEARNVVVMDSLPPRLEFVDGSQQSSLEMNFESQDNEVGSKTLRWSCSKALKPGEGGYIRFRCVVR
ncbi:MAG: hypothetical protein U0905_19490 [Pirellulales bacterium]